MEIGVHVDALGAGVQAVRKILDAGDTGVTAAPQDRERRVVVECGSEQNPVVDLDIEIVGCDREVVTRAHGEARAQVHRGLLLERFGAEQARGGVIDREDPDLLGDAADEIGHDLAEVNLAEAGRSKSGAGRRAKRDSFRGLEARCQLSGDHRAEVAVVLEPPRGVREEFGREVGFEVRVDADVISARLRLVGGRETRKDLRAPRRVPAELRGVPAVDVGRELSALDLVLLVAIGGADSDVERGRESNFDGAGCVYGPYGFVTLQSPGEE